MSAKRQTLVKPGDEVMGTTQWQTPGLTEVPLTGTQRHYIAMFTKYHLPENEDWHLLQVPEDAILAALSKASRATLIQHSGRHNWFQLAERDRRALRAVVFHDQLDAVLSKGLFSIERAQQSDINWLRWLAVCEARREGESWEKARETASGQLKATPAKGQPGAMKWSYDLVQRILKSG